MKRSVVFLSTIFLANACGSESSQPGTLEVRIYGETFIEQGIPASEFSDGWAVTFNKFLISVGDISAARGHESSSVDDAQYRVFDLAQDSAGAGYLVTSKDMVPGGAYDHVTYRLKPPTHAAVSGNAVVASDLNRLVATGTSVHTAGQGTKGGKTIRFSWNFPNAVQYRGCHGNSTVDGNTAVTQLTIHGDHLFYDDLVSTEPNLAFDLIAQSDTDGDGEVTKGELWAKNITAETRYQVGGEPITNLWDFIERLVYGVGHIDGEGHCETVRE